MPKIRKRQRDVRHLVLAVIYLMMTAFTAVILSNRELTLMLWGMFSAAMIIYLCYIPKPEPKPEVRIVKGATVQVYGNAPRPKWSDAPEYANWLAMDKDGNWNWYSHKPYKEKNHDRWNYRQATGQHGLATHPKDSTEWETSLEKRPEDEAKDKTPYDAAQELINAMVSRREHRVLDHVCDIWATMQIADIEEEDSGHPSPENENKR